MDINGAKALKKRLGQHGTDEASPAGEHVDVPADAAPVYHWTGKVPSEMDPIDAEDDDVPRSASLFSRLNLSFR